MMKIFEEPEIASPKIGIAKYPPVRNEPDSDFTHPTTFGSSGKIFAFDEGGEIIRPSDRSTIQATRFRRLFIDESSAVEYLTNSLTGSIRPGNDFARLARYLGRCKKAEDVVGIETLFLDMGHSGYSWIMTYFKEINPNPEIFFRLLSQSPQSFQLEFEKLTRSMQPLAIY